MKHRVVLAMFFAAALAASAESIVKNGEKVAFLGDSITEFGNWPAGYVNMVVKGLEVEGVKIVKIPAGISGNKSNQMLARLPKILEQKPEWLTLSCGVNDVWHGKNGVPLDQYRKNIGRILDLCETNGTKVVILTPTMIQEDAGNDLNKQLEPYNEWLRAEASRRGLGLADLNKLMRDTLSELPPAKGNRLTVDGVHMAWAGNAMMARGVLKAFGVDVDANPAIAAAWDDLPEGVRKSYYLCQADVDRIDSMKQNGETRKQCAERLMKTGVSIYAKQPEPVRVEQKNGRVRVGYLGGREFAYGTIFMRMVESGFKQAGYEYDSVVRVVNSKPTADLAGKVDEVITAKPDKVVFMAGTYELRNNQGKAKFEEIYTNLTATVGAIFDKFANAGLEVHICGIAPLSKDPDHHENVRAKRYNEWLKGESVKRGFSYVDTISLCEGRRSELAETPGLEIQGEDYLMRGYYHMIFNYHGFEMLAKALLSDFGVKAEGELVSSWRYIPQSFLIEVGFSRNEWAAMHPGG